MITKTTVSSAEHKQSIPWIYFHGEAETMMGFDLVACDQGVLDLGRNDVTIRDLENNTHEGISYLYNDSGRIRGYIVLRSDISAREDGEYILEKEPRMLY